MRLRQCAAVPVFVCVLQSSAVTQSISLSLEEALARAREQAPAVLIARARIGEARGRLLGARVRFRDNPTIDVGTGPRNTEAGTLTDLDVGFAQLFETGGQRAAQIAGAEAGIAREAASADDARRLALRAVALALFIDSHEGTRIPLGQLASIDQAFGPGAVRREAGSRRVAVEASATGRDLAGVAEDIQQTLQRNLQLPQGYFFNVGGRVESQARASRSLMTAIELALFAVVLLLYFALDSFKEAAVMLAIVMIGGLVTSTLFTLLVLPALYLMAKRAPTRPSLDGSV